MELSDQIMVMLKCFDPLRLPHSANGSVRIEHKVQAVLKSAQLVLSTGHFESQCCPVA